MAHSVIRWPARVDGVPSTARARHSRCHLIRGWRAGRPRPAGARMSVIEPDADLDPDQPPTNDEARANDLARTNDQARTNHEARTNDDDPTANHPTSRTGNHDLSVELATERTHLTESRAALARMRERAEALFATGETVPGDPFSAESLGRQLARRIAELTDDPSAPLFFGRLDFAVPTVEKFHIGRRHVVDDRGEPMVLDWRAPLSRAFYRASVRDPQGVTVRRRFGWTSVGTPTGRADAQPVAELSGFEDEHLDRGEELGTKSKILTTEIERPRVGPMRDIVATIQPEQDELVRADLSATICVQGAPGTGKTAVGLHRAAYLL